MGALRGECGKYLPVSMGVLMAALDGYGELVAGVARSSAAVRTEVLAMSPATIDRYLVQARARDPLRSQVTTEPSPLLRASIKVRTAGEQVEDSPGPLKATRSRTAGRA